LPAPERVEPAASTGHRRTSVRRTSRGRRILLVDDNEDALEMLAELLRAAGHNVLTAGDGPAALAAAPRFRPDIAVLDIGLPAMDGYELASPGEAHRRGTVARCPRGEVLVAYVRLSCAFAAWMVFDRR